MLIPWPNRLQDGSYEFNGRRYQLPLTEPEHRNAIHGLVRWSTWTATEREPYRVVVEHILYPQPGYPFLLGIRIEYALSRSGLQVRTTATNLGSQPCPFGSGAHPYLTLGTDNDRRFDGSNPSCNSRLNTSERAIRKAFSTHEAGYLGHVGVGISRGVRRKVGCSATDMQPISQPLRGCRRGVPRAMAPLFHRPPSASAKQGRDHFGLLFWRLHTSSRRC